MIDYWTSALVNSSGSATDRARSTELVAPDEAFDRANLLW